MKLHSWILLPLFLIPQICLASDSEARALLDIIKRNEAELQQISFKCRLSKKQVLFTNGRWEIQESSTPSLLLPKSMDFGVQHQESIVNLHTTTNNFFVTINSLRTSSDASGEIYLSENDVFVRDPTTFIKYTHAFGTRNAPSWDTEPSAWKGTSERPKRATIDYATNEHDYFSNHSGFLDMYALPCGIAWVAPYMYTNYEGTLKLSEMLQRRIYENTLLKTFHTEAEIWKLKFGQPYGCTIEYNPVKKRIEAMNWGGCAKCPDLEMSDNNWMILQHAQFEYLMDSIVPSKVIFIESQGLEGTFEGRTAIALVWEYDDAKTNSGEEIDASTLQISEGTYVEDHIRQVVYIQGRTVQDEEREVLRYLGKNNMLKVDDPRLKLGPPDTSSTSSTRFRLLILGNLFVLLCVGIYATRHFLRKDRK